MSEQLEDLMKSAGEARAQKRQRELDRKFFAWIEDTFNIKQYEKDSAYGKPAAVVDNSLVFVRANFQELSADVYIKCNVCINETHNFGAVKNLEELGECLKLDESGNLPLFCPHLLSSQPPPPVNQLLSQENAVFN
jgi:hypothetical protein